MTRRSWAARVFQRLDAVIAVNQEIADFMLRCGVGAERVHLISPHAPVQAAAELPAEIGAFFAAHDPVLLSVGLLEPEYDLPLQIRVLERVRRNHQNAGLVMIGSGSREAELRALMAEQPYREHMLLTGDVPHASTVRAIQDCRMLLRTTHYDGDALSVREALDLGTPVIATDNGMRPPACRLIPAPPAIDPLAARIEELLQEPVGARQAVGQSDTKNLEAVLGLYRSIL
jgi:glycosyltransferase involved in cell wall biosynthesis